MSKKCECGKELLLEWKFCPECGEMVFSLEELAEAGDSMYQYLLGKNFYFEKNYKQALFWWEKSANQNLADALYAIGVCYSKGEGVEKNLEEAKRLWLLAAKQGYSYAISALNEEFNIKV